jgi:hypothetical protein
MSEYLPGARSIYFGLSGNAGWSVRLGLTLLGGFITAAAIIVADRVITAI